MLKLHYLCEQKYRFDLADDGSTDFQDERSSKLRDSCAASLSGFTGRKAELKLLLIPCFGDPRNPANVHSDSASISQTKMRDVARAVKLALTLYQL